MSHAHIYVLAWSTSRKRRRSNLELAAEVRMICRYPNLRRKVMIPSALGGGETFFPIRALILGPDFRHAVELSKTGRAHAGVPGLLDVDASVEPEQPGAAGQDRPTARLRPRSASRRRRPARCG